MLDDKQTARLLSVALPPLGVAVELDMQCPLHFRGMIFDEIFSLSRQIRRFSVSGYLLVGVLWLLFPMMLMSPIPRFHCHQQESVALWKFNGHRTIVTSLLKSAQLVKNVKIIDPMENMSWFLTNTMIQRKTISWRFISKYKKLFIWF